MRESLRRKEEYYEYISREIITMEEKFTVLTDNGTLKRKFSEFIEKKLGQN